MTTTMTSFSPLTFAVSLLALLTTATHAASDPTLLHRSCINTDCSALRITLSHPPVNLFDYLLIDEIHDFLTSLRDQSPDNSTTTNTTTTKVVVFASDVPGFFASHYDLDLFVPARVPPGVNATAVGDRYVSNLELFSALPVIFIAEVDGRVWGAGDENVLHMDLRFAGPDALFGAPEAAGGLIHFGGVQQLARLVGPARTTEYLLSVAQVEGTEAARVGWVNAALPSAAALRGHVDALATRIALFDLEVIGAHKQSIARQAPPRADLEADLALFNRLAARPSTGARIVEVIEGSDNQTIPFEYNVNDNFVRLVYQ